MQEHLEPDTSKYEGLVVYERGPWYKQLWDSLSQLDGCRYGVGAILLVLAIPGNTSTVKITAVIIIGALTLGDEFRKSKIYGEHQSSVETKEAEP